MLWITNKGIDYLTHIIDKYTGTGKWTNTMSRDLDILGILERRGGGYTPSQIIGLLEARDIESPLIGTREQYSKSIESLEKKGFIVEVGGK